MKFQISRLDLLLYCFLCICFPGCAANHPEALLAKIKITAFSAYHVTVKLFITSNIGRFFSLWNRFRTGKALSSHKINLALYYSNSQVSLELGDSYY